MFPLTRAERKVRVTSAREKPSVRFHDAAAVSVSTLFPPGLMHARPRAELMFMEVLRRHIQSLPADEVGWLAALNDRSSERAEVAAYNAGEKWTVTRLAGKFGTLRTVARQGRNQPGTVPRTAQARATRPIVPSRPAGNRWRRLSRNRSRAGDSSDLA